MRSGIDCSVKVTKAVAEVLIKGGNTFAARYLVPSSYSKWLSPEEAQTLSDAGLDILSVFESTAARALSGFGAGVADGKSALACAQMVKQPIGSAIYFAVDFEAKPEQMGVIEQYLDGADSIIGAGYGVGVYGSYAVIEEMNKRKAARHFWQTYAWSGGKRSAYANVYQYRNGQTVAGIQVDLNNSFGNEGFWRVSKPKLTSFADVPAGHWAEAAIAEAVKTKEMTGYPDGTFGLGKPVTREELAVILQRLKGGK